MKIMKKRKGFTLVELITVVAVISLVIVIGGVTLTKIINNSKEQSLVTTKSNILTTARLYVEENANDIIWSYNTINGVITTDEYACIPMQELINKGLLKNNIKNKINNVNMITVWKDKNGVIFKETLDANENICKNRIIKKPTCNQNLEYNGLEQELIKERIFGLEAKSNIGKDAGKYVVRVKPTEGYFWEDNTNDEIEIICEIKKKNPIFTISPKGTTYEKDSFTIVNAKSNVSGEIKIADYNQEYYSVSEINNISEENEFQDIFKLNFIGNKKNENKLDKISITLIPENSNYNSVTRQFEIGDPVYKYTEMPFCLNEIYYNGENQTIVSNVKEGVELDFSKAKEIGNYAINVRLEYGYKWEDETTEDKLLNCTINAPKYEIKYNGNGSTSGTMPNSIHIYGIDKPLATNSFVRERYSFHSWNTKPDNSGISYNDEENIKNLTVNNGELINLYAMWQVKNYTVNYNGNGSTSGNMQPSVHDYDVSSKLTGNAFIKMGYTFVEWNTKADGSGTSYSNESEIINLIDNGGTINLYAQWRVNKVIINYNTNGGTITSSTSGNTWSTDANGTIYRATSGETATAAFHTVNYGSSINLNNYNNSTYINITKRGYSGVNEREWTCLSESCLVGKNYNQNTSYTTSDFCDASYSDCTVVLGVNWTINKITIKYNVNGGKIQSQTSNQSGSTLYNWTTNANGIIYYSINGSNAIDNWSTLSYGSSLDSSGLANWNNNTFINITKTGYSAVNGKEWVCLSGDCVVGTLYHQQTSYTSTDFCDASYSDCTVVLGVNWSINKIIIKYNVNGGTIMEKTGNNQWRVNNQIIQKLSNSAYTENFHTVNYGNNQVNLSNYNNNTYISISKNGLLAIKGTEWNTKADGSGTSYSQDINYKASDFCDASKSSCTVTLYVNWATTMYLCITQHGTSYVEGGKTAMKDQPIYVSADPNIPYHVLFTGTPVTILGTSPTNGTFYYVEIPETYRDTSKGYVEYYTPGYRTQFTDNSKYRGYIHKGCLLTNPINQNNYCTSVDCYG